MRAEPLTEKLDRIMSDLHRGNFPPRCVECDDTGWAYVRSNAVAPCANGCKPPTPAMQVRTGHPDTAKPKVEF